MPDRSRPALPIAQVLSLLASTPPRLTTLTAGLSPARLQSAPTSDEWSANEVLAHLRACADMWGNSIMAMLGEDRPTLRAINPRTWIKQTNYRELTFQPSLRAFAAQRAALLAVLEPLPPEGWSRSAIVTGAGRPLDLTVLSYAQRLALHERPHVKQIERIVATRQTPK
jgi:DinB family protein